ncbi:MAG: MarR family winged helix-turn-helix transcriptional regulator [Bdellovibrionota bacterium]
MDAKQRIEELLDQLGHLHRSYHREFAYSNGLNLRQLEALLFLSNCNRYSDTPLALSEYLGLTKGTVSQTIISLEDKDLLKKSKDPKDGRIVHLQLTKEAQKLVRQCLKGSQRAKALDESSEQLESLEDGLMELLKRIQHTNGYRTFGICQTCSHFRPQGLGKQHQCGLTLEPLYSKESLKLCREHTEEREL